MCGLSEGASARCEVNIVGEAEAALMGMQNFPQVFGRQLPRKPRDLRLKLERDRQPEVETRSRIPEAILGASPSANLAMTMFRLRISDARSWKRKTYIFECCC